MMTLKEVAENMRLFAESGSNPLPETIDKWLDSIDIHLLSQPQPVAQGEFSVQVTAERMDEVITSMQGPDGEGCAGTLWVGRLDDCGPDGSSRYGIHISCNECPEEGSVTLAEFDAPKAVAQGEAVALNAHKVIQDAIGFNFENSELQTVNEHDLLHLVDCVVKAIATPTIPTSHRVVPVEPTSAMIWDMAKVVHDKGDAGLSADKFYTLVYKAALAASPSAEGV